MPLTHRPSSMALTGLLAGCLAAGVLAACGSDAPTSTPEPTPTSTPTESASATPPPGTASSGPDSPSGPTRVLTTIADDLEVPWGLTALPDGDLLVTERDSGRVLALRSSEGGRAAAEGSPWRISQVSRFEDGSGVEGGLLGVAARPLDPEKPTGPAEVFVHLTTDRDNRVLRGVWSGQEITAWTPVLTGIPRADYHDGGRIAFGPDGHLYVATGDANRPELAQDRDSLAGKILRITAAGDAAPGNPFDSPVWSYGHRNVQGLAWDDEGQLWASEFGQNTADEVNRVERGGNHGWPLAEGGQGPRSAPDGTELVRPEITWPTDEASPSGIAFADGRLWVAGLRGERLWEITPGDGQTRSTARDHFVGEYGRLRTVVAAGDGRLWLTTSNRDGRGEPDRRDDRILEVNVGSAD